MRVGTRRGKARPEPLHPRRHRRSQAPDRQEIAVPAAHLALQVSPPRVGPVGQDRQPQQPTRLTEWRFLVWRGWQRARQRGQPRQRWPRPGRGPPGHGHLGRPLPDPQSSGPRSAKATSASSATWASGRQQARAEARHPAACPWSPPAQGATGRVPAARCPGARGPRRWTARAEPPASGRDAVRARPRGCPDCAPASGRLCPGRRRPRR